MEWQQRVVENRQLVRNVIRQGGHRLRNHVDDNDLYQEGLLGLIHAAREYDEEMGQFSTYAVHWITHAMKQAQWRESTQRVHIPRKTLHMLGLWRAAERQLTQELERPPTATEIAQSLGFRTSDCKKVFHAMEATSPFKDAHTNTIPADSSTLPLQHTSEELCAVLQHWDVLNSSEKAVLRKRFGLGGERVKTLEKIGHDLGLPKCNVARIEQRGLKKLQEACC